jgi:putative DNA primase/helicase
MTRPLETKMVTLEEAERKAVTKSRLRALGLNQFLALDIKPREMVLSPFMPTQGLVEVYAPRGVGKTHTSLGIAYAVASGGEFLRWSAPSARKVLFIDGEMPASTMQERLATIVAGSDKEPPDENYVRIVTPDVQEHGIPDLGTEEGQASVNVLLDDAELIVLDNISSLMPSVRENEADDWARVQGWMLELRRQGRAVLFVHHAGKGGDQRGTSRREDVLDTVVKLQRPNNYVASEGARFEVHYGKARGFLGDDARPFEAKLEVRDGVAMWSVKDLELSSVEQVASLLNEGVAQKDIADMLDLDKSTVSRHARKARGLGLVTGDSAERKVA